jgi:hypothetical protein
MAQAGGPETQNGAQAIADIEALLG